MVGNAVETIVWSSAGQEHAQHERGQHHDDPTVFLFRRGRLRQRGQSGRVPQ